MNTPGPAIIAAASDISQNEQAMPAVVWPVQVPTGPNGAVAGAPPSPSWLNTWTCPGRQQRSSWTNSAPTATWSDARTRETHAHG